MEKQICPVCCSHEIHSVVSRKDVPVHQNMLMPTSDKALNLDRGDLEMIVCANCGFVFNAAFDELVKCPVEIVSDLD